MINLCLGAQSIISVQVGNHPEFMRLSLSWPQTVNFEYEITSTGFNVRFFYKAELLLDRLIKIFPGSFYKHEGDQTILSIKVSPERKFEAKSFGNIIYLDVYKENISGAKIITAAPSPLPSLSKTPPPKLDKAHNVDLKNLFQKVADYLEDLDGNIKATIVSLGENGILLKYPDSPIAVYEIDNMLYIVLLKNEPPVFDKHVEEKFSLQLTNLNNGFVVRMPCKNFLNPLLTKVKDGWKLEFSSEVIHGGKPQLLLREDSTQVKISREGLLDPINVDGVFVCCTLNPEVFVPIHTSYPTLELYASSAGLAFKTDNLDNVKLDRDFITFLNSSSDWALPQDRSKKIKFDLLDLSESFVLNKKALVESIVNSGEKAEKECLNLILLYLTYGFASEANAEVIALTHQYPNFDPEQALLLRGMANIINGKIDRELTQQLFNLHRKSLENAAWYAFLDAQLNEHTIPPYLSVYLIDYIKILPNPLKSILLLTLADQLITQAHKDLAEEALSHIVEASLSNDAILLKQFLQLQIKRMKYAQTEPIELERLLRYVKNPTLMARLIMEGGFVDWKKKGHEKFIETLRSLIPLLEGDLLHAKALEYLIDYDVLMKNYLIVLDNAAILKNYYPKIYQQIKPKIQGILYYIICEKGFEKIGLIYTLQILNQFTEAIPVSPYVTEFILDLTQKLHRIGMLKESIQLLEAYFQRSEVKLTTDKQHDMVLQLLDFYVKSGNQRKALEFIDKIEHKKELNKDDAEIVRLLKARVALLNNDKEKALYFLQSSHELEGLKIKAAIFWELKNWSGAVDSISEIIDTYADRLDEERKERYIVHLAAALVLNEEKYQSRKMARQKTRITLNEVTQKYEKILKKYSTLLQELIIEPHNSLSDVLTKKVITDELKETDRLENLFNQVKAIPTH